MTKPLRIGILGCGMIGHAFLRQARTLRGVTVAAVCSRSAASQKSAAQLWPAAHVYATRDAFLGDTDVDAVLICTPHASHAADAIATLAAGKHVLIEKPIATSLPELADLEVAAAQSDRVVVALPLVDYPALSALAELAGSGIIGPPMEFTSSLDVPGPPRSNWYYSRAAVAGPALDTFPYALARLLALTGTTLSAATVSVSQAIQRRKCLDGGMVTQEVEDHISMQLVLPTGQQAQVKSSWCLHRPEDYLTVRGRSGDIRLDCWRNSVLIRSRTPPDLPHQTTTWEDAPAFQIKLPKADPESAKLAALVSAVARNSGSLSDTAFAMRLILRGLATANGGVELPKPPLARSGGSVMPLDLRTGTGYV